MATQVLERFAGSGDNPLHVLAYGLSALPEATGKLIQSVSLVEHVNYLLGNAHHVARPDLFLINASVPSIGGDIEANAFDAVTALRERSEFADVPVIVVADDQSQFDELVQDFDQTKNISVILNNPLDMNPLADQAATYLAAS